MEVKIDINDKSDKAQKDCVVVFTEEDKKETKQAIVILFMILAITGISFIGFCVAFAYLV